MKTLLIIAALAVTSLVNAQELRTFTSEGKYGFKQGNSIVIPATFSYAADFNSGLAAVMISKKWGFIDTKGRLVIQNKYENVESFNAGYARFYVGKKMGLLDSLGNEVVPATCDVISSDYYNNWYLGNGELSGLYLPKTNAIIEPVYKSYSNYSNFILAKKTGYKYDIYTSGGKLLGKDVNYPATLSNYREEICDLNWGDSTYLVDLNGKRLTRSYRSINERYCNYEITNEAEKTTSIYQKIYLLNLEDPNSYVDPESGQEISNRFHIYLKDGRVLNDAVYSDYMVDDNDGVIVKRNGILCNISPNGEVLPTKYIGKYRFHEFSLFYLPDSSIDVMIVNQGMASAYVTRVQDGLWEQRGPDTVFVGHFKNASVPFEESMNPYYDPDYYNDQEATVYGPTPFNVLEIEGEGSDKGKFALFDLYQMRVITKFDSYHKVLQDIGFGDQPVAVFKNESGMFAFSRGDYQSSYKFERFANIYGLGHTLVDTTNTSVFVPSYQDTIFQLPPNVFAYSGRSDLPLERLVIDPETGEEYYVQETNQFPYDFVLLQTGGETSKYGFIHKDIVSLPKYDEFIAPAPVSYQTYRDYPFFITRLDSLFGVVDLRIGYELEPMFPALPEFSFSPEMNVLYTVPIDREYYISSKGRVFTTQNPEVSVFTQNGKKGLLGTNDFSGNYDTLVPPLYKTLVPVIDVPYIVAGNKEKQKGLISCLGDTLIPMAYDDIKWNDEYEFQESYPWFNTFLDDKIGLYNADLGKGTPTVFDGIDDVIYPTDESKVAFIVRSEGKCGLYSSGLTELVPCNKVGIDIFSSSYNSLMVIEETNRVGCSHFGPEWYFNEISSPFWYDYIIGDYGYRKNENGYSVHQIINDIEVGQVDNIKLVFEDATSDSEITYTEEELYPYEIFMENDLMGLRVRESKKVLVKPTLRYLRMPDTDFYVKFVDGEAFFASIYSKKVQYKPSEW